MGLASNIGFGHITALSPSVGPAPVVLEEGSGPIKSRSFYRVAAQGWMRLGLSEAHGDGGGRARKGALGLSTGPTHSS